MTTTIDDLNRRYGIDGALRFEAGQKGLVRAAVTASGAGMAEAHVYLHGAHVTHYQRTGGKPVLFMSKASHFEDGKPIRGGVPVIFPWFGGREGHPEAPGHGLIRQREWQVESVMRQPDGSVELTFVIRENEQTLAAWPHRFEVRHRVRVGAALTMTLEVRNTSAESFKFEEGLHTYFQVSDVRKISVSGLDGVEYISKIEGGTHKVQRGAVTFTGETDRVHVNTTSTCVLDDPGFGRKISVAKQGSGTTVVWNPWVVKAKTMPDFGDDEWPEMVCIETVNAGAQAVTLAPGKVHVMTAVVQA